MQQPACSGDDFIRAILRLVKYLSRLGIPLNEVNAKGRYVNARALKGMAQIG